MYRQGDVLLVPVNDADLPSRKDLRYQKRKKGEGVILAAGEATGHHHRVREAGVREYRWKRGVGLAHERFLFVGAKGGTVTHEEHDPITLPPDTVFKIVQQREYEPVIKDNSIRESSRPVYD